MEGDRPDCGTRHQACKEVLQVLRVVREADDGTVFERLACIRCSGGEHVGKHNRVLLEETPVDTKGSIPGQEDDVAIFKPKVGIASEWVFDTICIRWFSYRSQGVDCLGARARILFRIVAIHPAKRSDSDLTS